MCSQGGCPGTAHGRHIPPRHCCFPHGLRFAIHEDLERALQVVMGMLWHILAGRRRALSTLSPFHTFPHLSKPTAPFHTLPFLPTPLNTCFRNVHEPAFGPVLHCPDSAFPEQQAVGNSFASHWVSGKMHPTRSIHTAPEPAHQRRQRPATIWPLPQQSAEI